MPLPGDMEASNGSPGGKPAERASKHKLFEEMKRKIAKYKAELEIERSKNRHFQKDKHDEIKQIKEQYEYEKTTAIETYQARLQSEKQNELTKLRETLSREKDLELRQVLRYKDEEVKQLKIQFSQEREDAVKVAVELQKRNFEQRPGPSDNVHKLQKEVKHLKAAKQELDEKYRLKCLEEKDKAAQLRKMKLEREQEMQRSLRRESSRDLTRSINWAGDGSEKGSQDDLDRKTTLSQSSERLNESDTRDWGRKSSAAGDHDGRRSSEVQPSTSRLDNRISGLKAENEALKRKLSEQGPSEEKIKKLKKRNAELAAIARRLEQKVTQLQQVQSKRPTDSSAPHDVEHMKKVFARQRAKDLAEHAKANLAKDKELETLRKKCQELTDQLSNSTQQVQNAEIYEDREELEYIVKQSAKERLRLERNLAKGSRTNSGSSQSEAEKEKIRSLEESNAALRRELDLAEKLNEEKEKLEVELTSRRIECDGLYAQINDSKRKLAASEEETKQLKVDLETKTSEFNQVSDECRGLRLNLSEVEADCEAAKSNVTELRSKLSNLESVVKQLNATAEKHKKLEKEHEDALQALKERQDTIRELQTKRETEIQQHEKDVSQLQAKVGNLEKSAQQQTAKHEQVSRQLEQLRAQAEKLREEKSALARAQQELEQERDRIVSEKRHALQEKERIVREKEEIVSGNLLKETQEMERRSRMVSVEIQTDISGDAPLVNGYAEAPRERPKPAKRVSKEAHKSEDEDVADSELRDIAQKIKALALSDTEDDTDLDLSG